MNDDPHDELGEMLQAASADGQANFDARVDRARRVENRSRRIRTTCRFTILICGLGWVICFSLGMRFGWEALTGLGCMLVLPVMVAGITLFFMGGLAPLPVRAHMSQRDRERLDR